MVKFVDDDVVEGFGREPFEMVDASQRLDRCEQDVGGWVLLDAGVVSETGVLR